MIILIAALARNGVIGIENRLPWHLPEDMKRFKRLTTGHPVIMGRSTFESLTGPLPGRTNIVLTRNSRYAPAGAEVAGSLNDALRIAKRRAAADIFVIGGSQIYALFLPRADKLELTVVDLEPPGDAWFPKLEPTDWHEIESEARAGDPSFEFKTLVRSWAHACSQVAPANEGASRGRGSAVPGQAAGVPEPVV